jgi:magnesium transporter
MNKHLILNEKDTQQVFHFEELHLGASDFDNYGLMEKPLKKYNLHPLTVEDCVHRNQRTKFEVYGEYLFLVWHVYCPQASKNLELHFILRPNSVLLIHDGVASHSRTWGELFFGTRSKRSFSFSEFLLHMIDTCVSLTMRYQENLENELEALEEKIISAQVVPAEILQFKNKIVSLERTMLGTQSTLMHLQDHIILSTNERYSIRNITDHLTRLQEGITLIRNQSHTLLDVYWGAASNRVNIHMRRLTAIATLFIPFSLWSSFFGMNFEYMPYKETWFFYFAIGTMLMTFFAVLYYLSRNQILKEKQKKTPRSK